MLLMARKKVENWAYWIIGDVISIPLYFMKGLVFTSFQYLVFLIIAVMGLIEWRRRYRNQQLQ
jgi:nicotinamide mononucleotide transporter